MDNKQVVTLATNKELSTDISMGDLANLMLASDMQADLNEEENYWGGGMYARSLDMDKGQLIIGHIHSKHTVNILSKGAILIKTRMEDEWELIEAPFINITPPNTQKLGYILEDSTMVNVMITDKTTIEETYMDVVVPHKGTALYKKYGIDKLLEGDS